MAKQTLKIGFTEFLAVLDLAIESLQSQIDDAKQFSQLVDMELALAKFWEDPNNLSPLLAILVLNNLRHQQIISLN